MIQPRQVSLRPLLNSSAFFRRCENMPKHFHGTSRRFLTTAAQISPEFKFEKLPRFELEKNQKEQNTMPPGYKASIRKLGTFTVPNIIKGSQDDVLLGKAIVEAWRRDGIVQVTMDVESAKVVKEAFQTSRDFFSLPASEKAGCVDDQSFAGYIASGEEITRGIADYSEIFTITKDLPLSDPRVQAKWPCHGPCPWPNLSMKHVMGDYTQRLSHLGDRLLQLIALGLSLQTQDSLTKLTHDGWHHMRVLRFPSINNENGKGIKGRGIGPHTDYGLLVIAAQDHIGGLFIQPPNRYKYRENWIESAADHAEDHEGWVYVPPQEDVFTVFPGDMMQFLTSNYLLSTPHKVGINTEERFAFAYFHEPNFSADLTPLNRAGGKKVHYGTHFTNMFLRNYPERVTTKRMFREQRQQLLATPELHRYN